MNTIPKFRAWDGEKFVQDEFYIRDGCAYILEDDGGCGDPECCGTRTFSMEKKNWDVSQSTGLLDKNGKEIFGGDIVKAKKSYNTEPILVVEFGEHQVGFDSDCAISATGIGFHFRWISGGKDFLGTPYIEHLGGDWSKHYLGEEVDWDNEFEIIGNVWETPNLTKQQK